MPVLAGLALVFLAAFAWRAGERTAALLWLVPVLAALGLGVLALAAWHRRRMAELHEAHLVWVGRYRNVSILNGRPWPKSCRDCGQSVADWAAARAHDDPDSSPCAAYAARRDELERGDTQSLPMDGWQAEVLGKPGPEQAEDREPIER